VPLPVQGSPVHLLKFQMAPTLKLLMSSGSKKEESRCICPSEAKASHSQKIWVEVSSSAPHPLHTGLLVNPIHVMSSKEVGNDPGLCLVNGR
jgi:hypothetical protein